MGNSVTGNMEAIFSPLYEEVVDSFPIGTLVFMITGDNLEIVTVNDRLIKFANIVHEYIKNNRDKGKWTRQTLKQAFSNDIFGFVAEDDLDIVQELLKKSIDTGYGQATFKLRGTEGNNTRWIMASCSCKKYENGSKIYYTLFQDNTSQVLYETQLLHKQKELETISKYDSLTNVLNRYSYNQFLDVNKSTMMRQTGILFADMNGLKAANDELGHMFGDGLIIGFADLLLEYFEQDEIFRISGDEFVVVTQNVSVVDFENRVREIMDKTDEQNIAAVGYKWESTVVDLKQAIYQTEQLMMIQKQRYYVSTDHTESKHRPRILNSLLEEMNNGQYIVYLQPKATLKSDEVIGAEALIRKIGKDKRMIPPFEFVPILEKELLISKIDFFVLEEVCKLLQRWKKENKRLIKISVNMSRVSIAETNFLSHILEICDGYEIEHKYLEFEITESTETKDNRKMIEIVTTLSELGFGVSLDDMGSDYSSLKMLTMKGVDTVKIDRSLVLQINENEGAALIRYVIALCHEIGKKCIAEGVEDKEQAGILADMDCDYYQGFLLDKPIPIQEFEKYIK